MLGCAIAEPILQRYVYKTMQVWNKMWQLLKVLLRLTSDLFGLFVQQ